MSDKLSCEDKYTLAGDGTYVSSYDEKERKGIFKNALGEDIPNPNFEKTMIISAARRLGEITGHMIGAQQTAVYGALVNSAAPFVGAYGGAMFTSGIAGAVHGAVYGPEKHMSFSDNAVTGERTYTPAPPPTMQERINAAKSDALLYTSDINTIGITAGVAGKLGADLAERTVKEVTRAVNYGVCKMSGP